MIDRRTLIAATGAALALPAAALASAGTISAQEANTRMQAGELILIDVRTESEWQEGVPKGAHMVTLGDPRMADKIYGYMKEDASKPVAVI